MNGVQVLTIYEEEYMYFRTSWIGVKVPADEVYDCVCVGGGAYMYVSVYGYNTVTG